MPFILNPEPWCCQVPVLFTGTMRDNLDPFEKHTDAEVWAALRRAHLAPVVENSPQVLWCYTTESRCGAVALWARTWSME